MKAAIANGGVHTGEVIPHRRSPSGSATRLVLHGGSTAQIADELALCAHTVHRHLKAVFHRTGVRSRRDLVAEVFCTH